MEVTSSRVIKPYGEDDPVLMIPADIQWPVAMCQHCENAAWPPHYSSVREIITNLINDEVEAQGT